MAPYHPCTSSVSKTRVCAYEGCRSSRLGGCTLTIPLFVGRNPTAPLKAAAVALLSPSAFARFGASILLVANEAAEGRIRLLVDDSLAIR